MALKAYQRPSCAVVAQTRTAYVPARPVKHYDARVCEYPRAAVEPLVDLLTNPAVSICVEALIEGRGRFKTAEDLQIFRAADMRGSRDC